MIAACAGDSFRKMKMKCSICDKPIVLTPSAKERAEKFGGEPSYYTKLFTEHSDCAIAKRRRETSELIQRSYTGKKIWGN